MPSPIVSSDFNVTDFSGDMCSQIQQLVAVNNKLKSWFEWAFDESGEPTPEFLITIEGAGAPVGFVGFYPVNVVPTGWLICNGQAVSRTTYARLFGRIGTFHGTGDGSTTFNVPDYQSRFLLGTGGTRATGDEGGEERVTLTTAQIPEDLNVDMVNPSTELSVANQNVLSGGITGVSPLDIDSDNSIPRTSEVSVRVGGDGESHENMPPWAAGLWLIRY